MLRRKIMGVWGRMLRFLGLSYMLDATQDCGLGCGMMLRILGLSYMFDAVQDYGLGCAE